MEKAVRSKDEIKGFLKAMYGGRTENGELGLDVKKGVALDKLSRLQRSRLLSEEVSLFACSSYLIALYTPANIDTRNSTTTETNSPEMGSTAHVCFHPFLRQTDQLIEMK